MLQLNESLKHGLHEYNDWTKNQVREEAFNMKNALESLAKREFTNHFEAVENLKKAQVEMQGKVEKEQQEMTTFQGRIQGLAATLGSALESLNFAASSLDAKEKTYERQQALSFQEINDVLANHTVQIGGNKEAISKGVDEMKGRLDTLREEITNILASDRGTMQSSDKDISDRISAMRSALNDDVARLQEFANQVSTGLKSSVEDEAKDVESLRANITKVHNTVEKHSSEMESIKSQQDTIAADTQSNGNLLTSVSSKVAEAEARLVELSKQLDRDSLTNKDAIESATKDTSQIGEELNKKQASIDSLQSQIGEIKGTNKNLAKQEASDFTAIRTSVQGLAEEIAKAEAIKEELTKLSANNHESFAAAQQSIDDIKDKAKSLRGDISTQDVDISGMLARIGLVEKAGQTLKRKSARNKKQVDSEISDLQTKLGEMLGLKSDIAAFSSKAFRQISNVASEIDSVKAGGDKNSQDAWKKLGRLSDKLDEHIAKAEPVLSKATADQATLSKDVHDLDAFKSDTSNLQAKLVKELTDVTQSLGILDTKFSGQNVDVQGKIAKIEGEVQDLPTKAEVDKGIADAKDIGNKNAQDLGDLSQKVDQVKADVAASETKINKVTSSVGEHIQRSDKQTGSIASTLSGEGDTLAKMARKLKDKELEEKVNRIFGRK